MSKKTCGCTKFVYKTNEKDHVPGTLCGACGHRRNYHEDYLDKPVPCGVSMEKAGLAAMKEAVDADNR